MGIVILKPLVVQIADRDQIDRCRQLRLQLGEVEWCTGCIVDRHYHDRAVAQHRAVLRALILFESVGELGRHARHAEEARELVHVQRVAAQLLDGEFSRLDLRLRLG